MFDKSYFKDDNPVISDYEYDKIKQEVLDLEKKHSFLKCLIKFVLNHLHFFSYYHV